jgi:hypothetical protein
MWASTTPLLLLYSSTPLLLYTTVLSASHGCESRSDTCGVTIVPEGGGGRSEAEERSTLDTRRLTLRSRTRTYPTLLWLPLVIPSMSLSKDATSHVHVMSPRSLALRSLDEHEQTLTEGPCLVSSHVSWSRSWG